MPGECVSIERRSDLIEFQQLVQAMNNLSFDVQFQHDIFMGLAGILHLGRCCHQFIGFVAEWKPLGINADAINV